MYNLKLENENSEIDIVVEIPEDAMTVFTLMTSFENILIEHGFSREEIEEFYLRRQRGFETNIDLNE